MTVKQIKAAIYTRKSTEHGLDQDFNSLTAQREAAEAYISSQKSLGWKLVNRDYSDGGISGGTMERPALQRLLEDVDKGRVDVIVVYKVDRLTRSLSDFTLMIEKLDSAGASFVSVTQQFNTSNSMGRLTLNVLLSFAQFEREVTSERIRDKICASKKKGMWMGGTVPLGYDNIDKKLVINEEEANTVRAIFETYLQNSSIKNTCYELNAAGYRTKKRQGVQNGGCTFGPGHINYILKNPLYIGQVTHKNKIYKGDHDPIIDEQVWAHVQNKIKKSKINRLSGKNFKAPGLLTGLIWTSSNQKLIPSHCVKNSKRYHYYISNPEDPTTPTTRYSATQIDDAVRNRLLLWLNDLDLQEAKTSDDHKEQIASLTEKLKDAAIHEQKLAIQTLINKVVISKTSIALSIDRELGTSDEPEWLNLEIDIIIEENTKSKKLIIPNNNQLIQKPDHKLISLIAKAHIWAKDLQSGKFYTMDELAAKHQINKADMGKQLRLAYLAPDIVAAILEGRQPQTLNATLLRKLSNLPTCWEEQRQLFNFT